MSSQMGIAIFVIAAGFVVAGLLNAVNQAHLSFKYIDENDDDMPTDRSLALYFDTPLQVLWSIIMCLVAGPYLVAIQSHRFWHSKQISASVFSICLLVSIVWSFCSGIFIVEAGLMMGFLQV